MKKHFIITLISALAISMLAGCGSSDSGYSKSSMALANDTYGYAAEAPAEMYDTADVYVNEESMYEESYDDDSFEYDEDVAESSKAGLENRKLITTLNMSVETEEFDELTSKIENRVDVLGGYIESCDFGKNYNNKKYANYVIRVPEDNLSAFTSLIENQSNILSQSKRVDDVTLTYVDIQSRKEVYVTEEKRLLSMLEEATDIETMLAIETRLSEVQADIESMEAQLRSFDNRCNFSTIYLNVQEVKIYTVVEEPEKTAWQRIAEGFMNSLENVAYDLSEFGIGFIIAIPYLIIIGIVLVVIIFILRLIIKAIIKKAKKVEQERIEKMKLYQQNAMYNNQMMYQNMMAGNQMMNQELQVADTDKATNTADNTSEDKANKVEDAKSDAANTDEADNKDIIAEDTTDNASDSAKSDEN